MFKQRKFSRLLVGSLLLALAVLLAACPGPSAVAPVISNFTADPASITEGQSSTLSWNVVGATSLSIDQGVGTVTDAVGSTNVSPTATTTYTLTATNSAGSVTVTVTVTAAPPPPPGPTFTFSLEPIAGSAVQGANTTTTATITPVDGFTGDVAFSLVTPPTGITLTGGPVIVGATEVTAPLTIAVAADATAGEVALTVQATAGTLTQSATFTLTVTSAPAVNSVTIDQGDGAIALPFTFMATVDAVGGANPAVTWRSNNPTVTVDSNGSVTSATVGALATITATSVVDPGRYDTVRVFVADAVVTNGNDIGSGSLRQVISDALPGDTVGFAWDVPRVLLTTVQLLPPVDARIHILQDVTISGLPGDRRVTIEGDTVQGYSLRSRLFAIPLGVTARFDNLILTGGDFIGNGGAIRNDGALTITNSTITGNIAWFRGGGIYNHGAAATLLVENSIISNNRAAVEDVQLGVNFCIGQPGTVDGGDCDAAIGTGNLSDGGAGGGIYNYRGNVTIEDSVISFNEVKYSGGGLYNNGAGRMILTNTDVLNNIASDERFAPATPRVNLGGGIYNQGTFSMTGGTVSGNWSALYGGGISNGFDRAPDLPMTLTDVVITGNTALNFEDPADSFGGGYITWYTVASTVQELGATSVSGNIPDERSINPVVIGITRMAPFDVRVGPRPVTMPVLGDDGR